MPSGFTLPRHSSGWSITTVRAISGNSSANDRVCEQEPVNILANVAVSAAGNVPVAVHFPSRCRRWRNRSAGTKGVSSTNTDLDLFLAVAGNASKVGQRIACSYNYGNTALSGFQEGFRVRQRTPA